VESISKRIVDWRIYFQKNENGTDYLKFKFKSGKNLSQNPPPNPYNGSILVETEHTTKKDAWNS